ncbi:MAG TPA: hypothetical protein VK454_11860 [Myxococcaceae bacterium]|nr:hypothetical protein [Myxococcaceae bacterium]
MNRGWVGGALAAAFLGGACLIPQEDNILPDLPPPLNQPPRIVESEVQPPETLFSVDGGTGCPPLLFQAPVEDPDVNDLLFFEYFVDANSVVQGTIPPSGAPLRTEEAAYTVTFPSGTPASNPGIHLVELVVADGPLINRVPLPRTVPLPDGGSRVDPTFAVSHAWQVTVTGGACP